MNEALFLTLYVIFDLMACFQGHVCCCLGRDDCGTRLGSESQDQKEGVQEARQGVWMALEDSTVIFRFEKVSMSFSAIWRQAGRWTDPAQALDGRRKGPGGLLHRTASRMAITSPWSYEQPGGLVATEAIAVLISFDGRRRGTISQHHPEETDTDCRKVFDILGAGQGQKGNGNCDRLTATATNKDGGDEQNQ